MGEKKIYSIDIGLNNATEFKFSDDIGKSLENSVYLDLRRQDKEIYYHRTASSECDFVITSKNQVSHAIQVTYDMSQEETKKREIKGLIQACKNFHLKNGTIITYDYEDEIQQEGIMIHIIPFYKWHLLS